MAAIADHATAAPKIKKPAERLDFVNRGKDRPLVPFENPPSHAATKALLEKLDASSLINTYVGISLNGPELTFGTTAIRSPIYFIQWKKEDGTLSKIEPAPAFMLPYLHKDLTPEFIAKSPAITPQSKINYDYRLPQALKEAAVKKKPAHKTSSSSSTKKAASSSPKKSTSTANGKEQKMPRIVGAYYEEHLQAFFANNCDMGSDITTEFGIREDGKPTELTMEDIADLLHNRVYLEKLLNRKLPPPPPPQPSSPPHTLTPQEEKHLAEVDSSFFSIANSPEHQEESTSSFPTLYPNIANPLWVKFERMRNRKDDQMQARVLDKASTVEAICKGVTSDSEVERALKAIAEKYALTEEKIQVLLAVTRMLCTEVRPGDTPKIEMSKDNDIEVTFYSIPPASDDVDKIVYMRKNPNQHTARMISVAPFVPFIYHYALKPENLSDYFDDLVKQPSNYDHQATHPKSTILKSLNSFVVGLFHAFFPLHALRQENNALARETAAKTV